MNAEVSVMLPSVAKKAESWCSASGTEAKKAIWRCS